jgi:small-conductance mechanosensitive channel
LLGRVTATDFVVRLGLVAISPGAILGGVALFLAGLWITRAIRRWLEVRYLPKTDLDIGLRTSVAAGVTYLGALIAIIVAFAYLGLSVAQIALFASALSVGIGFGLQAIIGNFVSGLILLAERPIRVGDWIAIGDLEGDVRKISIRATEIEMTDRSRLIVPNSELVSKTVRNVTHSGALGRVRLVLRVDAGADPTRVSDIVLHRLRTHPEVLKDPEPAVYMTDAREGALEFNGFGYVGSPRQAFGVKSELLFQIVPDLKAAGIALAAPATTVKVTLESPAAEAAEPAPSKRRSAP